MFVSTHVFVLQKLLPVQRQDELMLSEAFHEGVRHARQSIQSSKQASAVPQIINFDWHGMIRDLKEKESVRCLWEHLQGLLPQSDLSHGTMELISEQGIPTVRSRSGPLQHCRMPKSVLCSMAII